LIRLAGYRQLIILELVIFDRAVRVRSENSVNLTGIDTQSPKVLVQIFLSVCFCRANDFADFDPPSLRLN
jgi:hypothetical protein